MHPERILLVACDVVPGAEEELNRWYNKEHIPEILECPGFRSAARYESLEGSPRFVAIYEIENDDVLSTPELRAVSGWGPVADRLTMSQGSIHRRIFVAEP